MPILTPTALLQLNGGRHDRMIADGCFCAKKAIGSLVRFCGALYGLATRPMFFAQENDWIVWSNSPAG